ncbi:FUSC family protein [Cesiribacter andamanensis]|uniref:Inner membrane protein yccS n=1 Tax=Cesiribacter andamanensis AMV16 TaxID=1279009 RepID=M7NYL4_9BACT|nr:FUSC family membrane protein [Cesiribacter andamanensis]EMR03484.1 Inner membrane protein yccS [Cesiribacter andamanensis AMV16]
MGQKTRNLQYFLTGENFTDALRVTGGILLPPLVLSQLGYLQLGVLAAIGALSVSIPDIPGPAVHKRNGMLWACAAIFVVAMLTGFARLHPLLLGAELLLLSFLLSMFPVYGNRAAAVGSAALLVMIMVMDEPRTAAEVPLISTCILLGGVWYMSLSLLFYRLRPYRPVQQALGECVHAVARFLQLKATFYAPGTNLETAFSQLVAQQVLVNEKQEAVRELLFKSRLLVKESTTTSRRLLLTFVDLVDLYEQVTMIHYDYGSLRKRFGSSGILAEIGSQIERLADVLDQLGYAIQAGAQPLPLPDLLQQLEGVKEKIDQVALAHPQESILALKKVLVNLRAISQRIGDMHQYYRTESLPQPSPRPQVNYSSFVHSQPFSRSLLLDNLSPRSAIFKHAVRVAVACLLGYISTRLLPYGEHSYWVLLTTVVILKPAFSLSKQRNYHRLLGTLIGGGIGFCLLLLLNEPTILFALLVVLMIGTFSFIRTNYIISVIFMTPFVLIIFSFLGANNLVLVQERMLDTLVGSAIALAVSYLVFPSWESQQLRPLMQQVLEANMLYLQKLASRLQGQAVGEEDYKLARKEVYVRSANLSAAFQRMLSEPRSKQRNSREVHRFVVLNHILSASIATLAAAWQRPEQGVGPDSGRLLRRSLAQLKETCARLGPAAGGYAVQEGGAEGLMHPEAIAEGRPENRPDDKAALSPDERLLQEQLEFLYKISTDIRKSTEGILA